MTLHIKWSPKAQKNLRKLEPIMSARIIEKIDLVVQDPFRYLEHFEGSPLYKLRIGNYRLLVQVDFHQDLFIVRFFDHRKRVYKR